MKKFLVVLLACAMIFGFAATASAADTQIKEFSDIADQSQAAQNAIMKLAVLGVVEGNEGIGGSFRPADNLTRAEFAKIVCYLTGNVKAAEALANVGSKFPDVQVGSWYTGWINMAVQAGYFQGDTSGNFRPNANITMNEVVTVALRAAGYNDKLPGTWPANYALKAQNVGLLDDVTFVGSAAATRADMSLICSEVLGINMVVHISNEIAYALALSDGTVDPDGFSETYYVSNETSYRLEETILHKAFDGVYYYVLANQTELPTGDITGAEANYFDESNGWAYEDYDSDEITLNILGAISYIDDDFDDYYTKSSSNSAAAEYNVTDSLASTYHIAGSYGLADLSGMQLQVLVIDKKAINYIEPYSSYVLAKSVYRNSASNIVADGKTYRASTTMGVAGKVTNEEKVAKEIAADKTGGVIDLTVSSTFGGEAIQYLHNSSSDDDFPGKIYLDKDGRVYATKNYNAYNEIPFGIVDELDNEVVLKAQTTNWKTTGSTGSDTNYTLDTDEPYVLYKDGELIKADELAENDVITYLGDNGGHFYYVTSPVEGDFTQQTSSKMTVGGYGYRQVTGFFASDDGGEDFDHYSYAVEGPFDTASFGEVEIATAYNFSRLDYIALNTTANKVIGVVTNADPDSVYASGSTSFIPQFKKLTIYNAEGKEVTYTFTTNFRNAYNRMLSSFDKGYVPNADYSSSSTPRWGKDYFDEAKSLEGFTREIQEGDIVQLTLDKSDNIKKISNYVAFDGTAKDDGVEATVKASNNRITIKGNNITKEDGTYTLPTDAIVFNVTVDGGDYDDVDLKTVASTLSADFKAMKIVAFDTKSNGNINALYIVEGVSAYKFGIISGQGRDATDDYYTINGKRVYSDGSKAAAPSLVAYQISGGDASVTHELAWGGGGKEVYYLTDMHAVVSGLDKDYGAAVGVVKSYSSSTNALNVNDTLYGEKLLYVTSDTFMYDFPADDDLTSASSLRDKYVAVIYNDDFDAIAVALLSDEYKDGAWTKLTGQGSVSTDDKTAVANANTALAAAIGSTATLEVPYGADTTDKAVVEAAIAAIIKDATVVVDATDNGDGTWAVTLTKNNATTTVTIKTVKEAAAAGTAELLTVFSLPVSSVNWEWNADGYYENVSASTGLADPFKITALAQYSAIPVTLSNGATPKVTTVSFSGTEVSSTNQVNLSVINNAATVYIVVTAQNGQDTNYYKVNLLADKVTIASVALTATDGYVIGKDVTAQAKDAAGSNTPADVTYQWQVSTNGTSNWTDATGANHNTATYTIAAVDAGKYLRARATGGGTTVLAVPVGYSAVNQVTAITKADANADADLVGDFNALTGVVASNVGYANIALDANTATGTLTIKGVTVDGNSVSTTGVSITGVNVRIPVNTLVDAAIANEDTGDVVITYTSTCSGVESDNHTLTFTKAQIFTGTDIGKLVADVTAIQEAADLDVVLTSTDNVIADEVFAVGITSGTTLASVKSDFQNSSALSLNGNISSLSLAAATTTIELSATVRGAGETGVSAGTMVNFTFDVVSGTTFTYKGATLSVIISTSAGTTT